MAGQSVYGLKPTNVGSTDPDMYKADSVMAMGNFDETAKELPWSLIDKNTIFLSMKSTSCLVSVELSYSIEFRELELLYYAKNSFSLRKRQLILIVSAKSKVFLAFDSK